MLIGNDLIACRPMIPGDPNPATTTSHTPLIFWLVAGFSVGLVFSSSSGVVSISIDIDSGGSGSSIDCGSSSVGSSSGGGDDSNLELICFHWC